MAATSDTEYPCQKQKGISVGYGWKNLEKKMRLAKSPIISGFFATQTAIFLCTKT